MERNDYSQLDLKLNEVNGNISMDFCEFCIKLSNIMNRNTKGFLCARFCLLVGGCFVVIVVCLSFHTI